MDTLTHTPNRKRGQRLTFDQKIDLIESIAEVMSTEGIVSVHGLAKRLKVNTTTIIRYLPYATKVFNKTKVHDRTYHRNLLIQRTLHDIEQLSILRDKSTTLKEKLMVYSQLIKYDQLLAVITGILYDAQNQSIEQSKVVIIKRPAQSN